MFICFYELNALLSGSAKAKPFFFSYKWDRCDQSYGATSNRLICQCHLTNVNNSCSFAIKNICHELATPTYNSELLLRLLKVFFRWSSPNCTQFSLSLSKKIWSLRRVEKIVIFFVFWDLGSFEPGSETPKWFPKRLGDRLEPPPTRTLPQSHLLVWCVGLATTWWPLGES